MGLRERGPAPRPDDRRPASPPEATRCAVCGCEELRLDEVLERGGWLLAECPRCDHRATQPLPAQPLPRRPLRVGARSARGHTASLRVASSSP